MTTSLVNLEYQVVTQSIIGAGVENIVITLDAPTGYVVIGFGYDAVGSISEWGHGYEVQEIYPATDGSSVTFNLNVTVAGSGFNYGTVYATCLSVALY